MQNLLTWWKEDGEKGQGMVEYGLIVALLAVAIVLIFGAFTGEDGLGGYFTQIISKMEEAFE